MQLAHFDDYSMHEGLCTPIRIHIGLSCYLALEDAFPELWEEIQKAIKRTSSNNGYIKYKYPKPSRIALLKRILKRLS